MKLMTEMTENESFTITHWSRFGSDGYPIIKRGSRWWVDGIRGCGACPAGFRTKREAVAQWERYINILIDKSAGRI
jgi:hypothetical protein